MQEVVGANEADVDTVIDAATETFKNGEWATATSAQRAKYLKRLADLIDENAGALAHFESLASGRPVLVRVILNDGFDANFRVKSTKSPTYHL